MFKIGEPDRPIVGKQAFITRRMSVLERVCGAFGRKTVGMCLKVFYGNPLTAKEPLRNALWGDNPPRPDEPRKNTTVFAGSQVQNILWRHGLAPRVYAVFEAEYKGQRVACQLTDFVKGSYPKKIEEIYELHAKINELGKQYGFTALSTKMGKKDAIGGLCIDPQLWAFDLEPYEDVVKRIYNEKGRYGKIYYQNEPKIGCIGGPRKSKVREKDLMLDKIDFKGKVVWDVGCGGGYFLRYAMDHGAKRAIGFDTTEQVEAAFHAGNLLGYFNIDYVECDLNRGIPLIEDAPEAIKPDVAFFLSMVFHLDLIPERLFEADTIIFEDNGKETRHSKELYEPWISRYKNIEFIGKATDHGDKHIWHLRR